MGNVDDDSEEFGHPLKIELIEALVKRFVLDVFEPENEAPFAAGVHRIVPAAFDHSNTSKYSRPSMEAATTF